MKANRIFTRQVMGLDHRVFNMILVVCLISIGLLSYRLIDKKECTPVNFVIKTITLHTDSSYLAGETLSFIASANENEISCISSVIYNGDSAMVMLISPLPQSIYSVQASEVIHDCPGNPLQTFWKRCWRKRKWSVVFHIHPYGR